MAHATPSGLKSTHPALHSFAASMQAGWRKRQWCAKRCSSAGLSWRKRPRKLCRFCWTARGTSCTSRGETVSHRQLKDCNVAPRTLILCKRSLAIKFGLYLFHRSHSSGTPYHRQPLRDTTDREQSFASGSFAQSFRFLRLPVLHLIEKY